MKTSENEARQLWPGYLLIVEKIEKQADFPIYRLKAKGITEVQAGEFLLFPGAKKIKIKNIKSGPDFLEAEIKSLPSELIEGSILVPANWPVFEAQLGCFVSLFRGSNAAFKKYSIRGGLVPDFSYSETVDTVRIQNNGQYLFISLNKAFPLIPGNQYTLVPHKKELEEVSLQLIIPQAPFGRLEQSLYLFLRSQPAVRKIYIFNVHEFSFLPCPPFLQDSKWPDDIELLETTLIKKAEFEALLKKLLRFCSQSGGADKQSIMQHFTLSKEKYRILILYALKKSNLQNRNGNFFLESSDLTNQLSPFHKAILQKVEEQGSSGYLLNHEKIDNQEKVIEDLDRMRLLIFLKDINTAYSKKAAEYFWQIIKEQKQEILDFDKLKQILPFSRKNLLAWLDYWERKGLMQCLDNNDRKILQFDNAQEEN